jgi:hypothetical protein
MLDNSKLPRWKQFIVKSILPEGILHYPYLMFSAEKPKLIKTTQEHPDSDVVITMEEI